MLDYQKINKQAKEMGVTPQQLIKRAVNYRKSKTREMDCRFCKNMCYMGYPYQENRRQQCDIVGHGITKHADVDHLHICNEFEGLKHAEKHDYKKYINKLKEREDESKRVRNGDV